MSIAAHRGMPARQYKTALRPRRTFNLSYPSWLPGMKTLRRGLIAFVIVGVLAAITSGVWARADSVAFDRGVAYASQTAAEIASAPAPYITAIHGGQGKGYTIKYSDHTIQHTPSLVQFLKMCHQQTGRDRVFCQASYSMADTWMGFFEKTLKHKNATIRHLTNITQLKRGAGQ